MPPVDPLTGPRFALRGRVVTMDAARTVLARGDVYVDDGTIAAVLPVGATPPPELADVVPVPVGGTIYPGLIELHNHLPYDVLALWAVPKLFRNRSQWGGGGNPEYRRLVTGPMTLLGEDPDLMPAVVRYVECKALLSGVTTSQGIRLFSSGGATRYYRGIVRNVEQTDDPALPEADTRVADVEAADAERFLARLQRGRRLILHLSEGLDADARRHFAALQLGPDRWAVTENLVGIHCAALTAADFGVLAAHGASMVWSPLSNLLLYGGTADIAAARRAGVRIGLGSDWSPTGSKGLLGELKAARLAADAAGADIPDADLVAMATSEAAGILGWQGALGSVEAGRRADLLVVAGTSGDPYGTLVSARDGAVRLVVVAGAPRYGTAGLMTRLGVPGGERLRVGGSARILDLAQASADPVVGALSLGEARRRLTDALAHLPELAREREERLLRPPSPALGLDRLHAAGPVWRLALDEIAPTGAELRPRLPVPVPQPGRRGGAATLRAAGLSLTRPSGPLIGVTGRAAATAKPLSEILQPMTLDPLTVADDDGFGAALEAETNLPPGFGTALATLLR